MFDHDEIADRVARLKAAYDDAKDNYIAALTAESAAPFRDEMNVRKLALLKIEQALLIADF